MRSGPSHISSPALSSSQFKAIHPPKQAIAKALKPAPAESPTPAATDKVDLSKNAKDLGQKSAELLPKVDSKEASSAAESMATELAKTLTTSAVSESIKATSAEKLPASTATPVDQEERVHDSTIEKLAENSHRPAIFFIGGLELFSGGYGGIKQMADKVPGAKYYSWDQKSEMIEEIKHRHPSAPIALVGHSYGGDTAVKVAEELNTLENGFRKVNLLATLDAVGRSNDIIPQNVRTNLNFFGEKNPLLNDGPKVARDISRTQVINELRPEAHTDLDDSKEIQLKIVEAISQLTNPGLA